MINIIKAQNYQIKGDIVIISTFLLCLVIPFLGILLDVENPGEMTGSMCLITMGEGYAMILAVVSVIFTGRICGWDFADKTMNYEVLSGHSRWSVYWGRVLASLFWGLIAGIVIMALPLMVMTLLHGWGQSVEFGTVFPRLLLLVLTQGRLICELVLLTFLFKNGYVSMILGWVFYASGVVFSIVIEESFDIQMDVQFVSTNMSGLMQFDNYSSQYIGGQDVMVFEGGIAQALVGKTVLWSLVVGALCLLAGFLYFRKCDLD